MKHKFLLLFSVLHFWESTALGQNLEFYVSVDGSDSWDGTSESNIDGSDVGPWQTLNHAFDELRQIRPNPPTAETHATIFLLPGSHFLTSTIQADGRDSHLTIKSLYEDENVAVSGGLLLNGEWSEEDGGIRTTTFQGPCGEGYIRDHRLVPARSPNLIDFGPNTNMIQAPYNIIKGLLLETEDCIRDTTAKGQDCPYEDRLGFVFEDEFSADWSFLEQTKVLIYHAGKAELQAIGNITEENGEKKVFFASPLDEAPIGDKPASSGWRFLIFNNKALLDTQGEYVCIELEDGITSQFSYIPPDGTEDMAVVVTQLNPLINFDSVTDLHLEGIIFKHSSGGYIDGDTGGWNKAAIRILHSQNVVITDCKFTQTGTTALWGTDSSNVRVTKSVFTDVGYHGVQFHYIPDDGELEGQTDVSIDNNLFDGCGMSMWWQPACVRVGGYMNISVKNNEITNVPYNGIRIYGLMPHGSTFWDDNGVVEPTNGDYVYHTEFNYIHDTGLGILNDMGAIYLSKLCEL